MRTNTVGSDSSRNEFKLRLVDGPQLGLFSSLGGALLTELFAACGFDWILIDTEHSPNELGDVVQQLQILNGSRTSAIVRPAHGDPVLIKRLLDVGVRTILIPDVRSADQAAAVVRATRYPPHGIRGVSGNSRASLYGLNSRYGAEAHREICLLLQIESVEGANNLEEIAAVEGVDGIFIGAADLAASMGHLGHAGHPEVQTCVSRILATLKKIGMPAGYLTTDENEYRARAAEGIAIIGIATDTSIITQRALELISKYRQCVAALGHR